ncbi:NAD(P)-dependent dehydrogenase (short-subunit alcohol dehydrogenase family) [Neobacillus cucumis]|nr:NAD(P)-dependent dehydrogenase (short-subunit alcohol dehydrogenase family) [Neobacillus cucumis]
MSQLLQGKTALITGSASGIGLEMAKTFAQEGASVVISDLHAEKSEQAAAELRERGFEAWAAPCDVTNEEAFKNSIQQAYKTFGRLDILVNNAGMQYVAPIEEFPTKNLNS